MTCTRLGHMGRLLREEPFIKMMHEFSNWRIDSFIRQMEKTKSKGRVLPFVRGLRLSAQLIYIIREILSGSDLTANWGHLLDDEQNICSCECDVIIHKTGHIHEWNGTKDPVMNFKFIEHKNAVAVISCKSHLKSSDIDKEYCKSLKPFVRKVWLFAECCGPASLANIRRQARKYGYKKFWTLYTWTEQLGSTPAKKEWISFVEEIERLKN